MIRFLACLFVLFAATAFAEEAYSDAPDEVEERQLYVSVVSVPDSLFKGEIFSIELRAVVTTDGFDAFGYRFEGGYGVRLLSAEPIRGFANHTYRDLLYFKATASNLKLPDIIPVLKYSDFYETRSDPLAFRPMKATVLNPPKDFCGILAERFSILHAKTTVYDRRSNIVVFMADANRSDLSDFTLPLASSQGFESIDNGLSGSAITYYAVIPSTAESLEFSYFNLTKRAYESIQIPIILTDDSVSTQSDLKPTEQGHQYLKTLISGTTAALFLILFIFRRHPFYLLLAVAFGAYTAWLGAPIRHVCIRKDAPIYLLPMRNATVFEIAPENYSLEVQGHIKGYTKVRLTNNNIGWVKDEDTCSD